MNQPYVFTNIKATCGNEVEYQIRQHNYEIIEISAIVFDSYGNLYDYIQIFIKPRINPILTEICKTITNIKQEWIDGFELPRDSEWYSDIQLGLNRFIEWISNFENPLVFNYGNWDLNYMLPKEAATCWVTIPEYLKCWCNIKLEVSQFFNINSMRLNKIMEYLNIIQEDNTNAYHYILNGIKLVTKMINSGYIPKITSYYNSNIIYFPPKLSNLVDNIINEDNNIEKDNISYEKKLINQADDFNNIEIKNSVKPKRYRKKYNKKN